MPRLYLRNYNAAHFEFFDSRPPHRRQRTPSLRLVARILIGPDPPGRAGDSRERFDAIVDTGAPLSMFPHAFWSLFPSDAYERLNPANVPSGQTFPTGLLIGGRYEYEFGRVWVGVIDDDGRRLPALPVVAQLMRPGHTLGRPIIGMSESVLTGRTLTRRYSADARHE